MSEKLLEKEDVAILFEDNSIKKCVAKSLLCHLGYFNRTVSEKEARRRLMNGRAVKNLSDSQTVLDYLSETGSFNYEQDGRKYSLYVDNCDHFGKPVYFFRQENVKNLRQ